MKTKDGVKQSHDIKALAVLAALRHYRGKKDSSAALQMCAASVRAIATALVRAETRDPAGAQFHFWRADEMLGLNKSRQPRVPYDQECRDVLKGLGKV